MEAVHLSVEELTDIVLTDLSKIMNIKGDPEFSVISRFVDAMPQYVVGHQERVAIINEFTEKELQGVIITGSSYTGVGVPDCIDAGETAALKTIEFLLNN